jgi:hypothetical protein
MCEAERSRYDAGPPKTELSHLRFIKPREDFYDGLVKQLWECAFCA